MCGIVAVLNSDPARPADRLLLKAMSDRIAHRGPDAEGFYVSGPVGLASRRLAIIDVETGQQPIADEENRIWVVFNGEVYNYAELREDLLRRGHRLRTRGDTETIVHLYEEYGDDLVRHLRGMFAFALWDGNRKRLLLARDRLGKKPLVYAQSAGAFVAASEIKALLPVPGLDTSIDPLAIDSFLTHQSIAAPMTIYRGIRKLPPAHIMVIENGHTEIRRYWEIRDRTPIRMDEHEYRQETLRLLREAVRLRLISEVPLGAFLSGGIDSSLVVRLMQEASTQRVKTFSIGFEEEGFSELPFARRVAEHVGTDHHEFVVRADAIHLLPELARAYDEPFADPSSLPSYHLAQQTREHVTVALNGDGGDEAFGGYARYLRAGTFAITDKLPPGIIRSLASATRVLRPRNGQWDLARKWEAFLRQAGQRPFERYAPFLVHSNADQRHAIYNPEFGSLVASADPLARMKQAFEGGVATTVVDRQLAADLETYLPDTLLVKMDIASMAHSLEARSPFLDHVLMEFAARVPAHLKIRGGTTKYLLRRIGRDLLPAEILRRRKQGFSVPVSHWIRHDLRGYVADVILSARSAGRGYFRPEVVRRLLEEHWSGGADHGPRIWDLLILELWHRVFVDQAVP